MWKKKTTDPGACCDMAGSCPHYLASTVGHLGQGLRMKLPAICWKRFRALTLLSFFLNGMCLVISILRVLLVDCTSALMSCPVEVLCRMSCEGLLRRDLACMRICPALLGCIGGVVTWNCSIPSPTLGFTPVFVFVWSLSPCRIFSELNFRCHPGITLCMFVWIIKRLLGMWVVSKIDCVRPFEFVDSCTGWGIGFLQGEKLRCW